MYTLEFYEDFKVVYSKDFTTKEKCNDFAKSILKNVKEYDNSYCMVWFGGKMVSYIN